MSARELVTSGCEMQCIRGNMDGPDGSTQRITMVTAIRGLMGEGLGHRGRLERQLTEESALTLDDSTDSSPSGLCRTSRPQRTPPLQNGDVASRQPFSEGEGKNGTEAKIAQH
ncbi:unnamed protein product [Xyrichtys novacula]|uniref:Unnamed protein product n=1 Tax=Xyrichtys novacula TaxID=13765 RepID=A0AAV1FJ44_XYRNO|nr:unnamed protein product [Xyrichtys novacula]